MTFAKTRQFSLFVRNKARNGFMNVKSKKIEITYHEQIFEIEYFFHPVQKKSFICMGWVEIRK